jgi:hypothetical protein
LTSRQARWRATPHDSDLVLRTPPIKLRLTPWATDAAEALHRRFGDDVELTVGWLPYPPGRPGRRRQQSTPRLLPDLLNPDEVAVELNESAVVSSGHTLSHYLTVHNLTGRELQLATNGGVTAVVVDLQTGETVGGFSGAQIALLRILRVPSGGRTRVSLRIGTASSSPKLGYAVPPGEWGIQVTLVLGPHPIDSPHRRTPVLPPNGPWSGSKSPTESARGRRSYVPPVVMRKEGAGSSCSCPRVTVGVVAARQARGDLV